MSAPRRGSATLGMLRTPLGSASTALLLGILAMAVVAPIVWGGSASAIDTNALSQGPSSSHLLGTDSLGRDILFRLLVASRLSVELALLATIAGVTIGSAIGLVPSVVHRRLGAPVTAMINVLLAFPTLLVVLFLAVVFGVSTTGAVFALALSMAPYYARLTQTLAASVVGRDFVAAARIAGAGRLRIAVRHVLPNIADQLAINAAIGAGGALLSFAGLSFLGIGVQPPRYDWGRLLSEGVSAIYENPAGALGPAVGVVLAGLAFNLAGEAAAGLVNGDAGAAGSRGPKRRRPTHVVARTSRRASDPSYQPAPGSVLEVEDLTVSFPGPGGQRIEAVRSVSFTVDPGEAVGVVGESGSGKTLTALAVARLIDSPGRVEAATVAFDGRSLLPSPDRADRRRLATTLAMVFQDPSSSFNPARTIGDQLTEVPRRHEGTPRSAAWARAVAKLKLVHIAAPARRAAQYPRELSGGMRQRAMIAMGLMGQPKLIVADEPTTALDVTVQRSILELITELRISHGVAVLLISHDIDVISRSCDRVMVMYAGTIVEDLPVARLRDRAQHPYTRALVAAVPTMTADRDLPLASIAGRPPEPGSLPAGCAFAARCPRRIERCGEHPPPLAIVDHRHRLACWNPYGSVDLVAAHGSDRASGSR